MIILKHHWCYRQQPNEIESIRPPPPRCCYKINVDAAFNVASKIASLGVVSKNDEALIDFTTLTKVPGVESPLHAESLTIQFSL